ncbi:MAG: response regulator [Ardenticatenaceae bacterium]|nr:response regulator [Anaerolineales bacterium]MCB8938744.1 response regulator [Ardenticatenaceae bacterium]MCB8973980.1 response regulator [Ardenticatenaceae bacterium]
MQTKLNYLKFLNRFLDWFIADKIKNSDDSDDMLRRHRIIIFLITGSIASYVVGLVYIALFEEVFHYDFYVLAAMVVLYIGLLVILKRTGAFTAVVVMELLINTAGMLEIMYSTGGFESPIIFWIIASPLFTMLLLGVKASIINLVALVILIFLLSWIQRSNQIVQIPPAAVSSHFRELTYLSIAAFLTFLGWLYEYARLRALDRWNSALIQLQATNEQLRLAQQAAEAATEAKSEFLANMSHEIRTPLSTIIGLTSLMLDTPMNEEQADFLQTMRVSGDSLLALINDILDFSKIEAGKLEIVSQTFYLPGCILETLDLLANQAAEKELLLTYEIEPSLPAFVEGDEARTRQVLLNLLSNAVKFTEAGSVNLSVTGEMVENGRLQLSFSVQDTGIGIPQEQMDRLFQSFSQVDASTTKRYGGTGLGLAISKRLVEAMSGDMWVESEPDVGSTFFFTILVDPSQLPESNAQTEALLAATIKPTTSQSEFDTSMGQRLPLRILLAEDNLTNQKVGLRILERLGYQADVATNGLEVLEALHDQEYDLVLMDVQMPEMDGVTATQRIHQTYQDADRPTIIALTANALDGDRERFLQAGMDDYISKPIRIQQLMDAMERNFAIED